MPRVYARPGTRSSLVLPRCRTRAHIRDAVVNGTAAPRSAKVLGASFSLSGARGASAMHVSLPLAAHRERTRKPNWAQRGLNDIAGAHANLDLIASAYCPRRSNAKFITIFLKMERQYTKIV